MVNSSDENFISSNGAWAVAGVFAFTGSAIQIYNIRKHLIYFTNKRFQVWILRILLIVPTYAITNFFSLGFSDQAKYFEIISSIYEAIVIYCFLMLCLEYVGGEGNFVSELANVPAMHQPFPCCCLQPIDLDIKFIRHCKQYTIQFVIIKPLIALMSIILIAVGHYESRAYSYFRLVVYNVSYTLALYGLGIFYLSCYERVQTHNLVLKFLGVKSIIFATYWQSLVVAVIFHESEEEWKWDYFVLCVEMLFFSILHLKSFPWWEYRKGMPELSVLEGMKDMFSVKDYVNDAYHSFMPTYQEYVVPNGDHNRVFKTRSFLVGNLSNTFIQLKDQNIQPLSEEERDHTSGSTSDYTLETL